MAEEDRRPSARYTVRREQRGGTYWVHVEGPAEDYRERLAVVMLSAHARRWAQEEGLVAGEYVTADGEFRRKRFRESRGYAFKPKEK